MAHELHREVALSGPGDLDPFLDGGVLEASWGDALWLRYVRDPVAGGWPVGPLCLTVTLPEWRGNLIPRGWVSRHVGPPTSTRN